jgi:hypothetical protein
MLRNRRLLALLVVPLLLLVASGTATAQTPVPTPVVTLTPATQALSCAANTNVAVNVTIGGVAAPDGTQVTISASAGTVAPAIVSTGGGNGAFTYFAPASGTGMATINGTSMSGTGSTTLSIFCGPGGGATQPNIPGAALGQPVVQCIGGQANVTFSWTPVPGASVQWVDLTLNNNGFAPDSFVGFGPLNPATNQIQWNGLIAGRTHWWRVSAGVPGAGWAFSQTGAFTPCGTNPAQGNTTFACIGGGRANVTFGLGPPPAGTSQSWVDISLFNNGFAPGTFIGGNSTSVTTSLVWPGILANTTHWWRANNLTPAGWVTTTGGVFFASC